MLSADVVVVGAGIAGWTAALQAEESGADVLLIDKSSGEYGNGNSLMVSGSLVAAGKSARSDPEDLYREIMKEGVADPELARAWAKNCAATADWLESRGLEIVPSPTGQLYIEPASSASLAPVYKKDVGRNILKKLKDLFLKRGGRYLPETKACGLRMTEPGAVHGVRARRNAESLEIASRAVILTTGGFSANQEMLVRYVGPHADQCRLRGSPECTGDGLRMALEVGARAANLNYFYGHLLSLKSLIDDRFWPYPRIDSLVAAGLLVNRSGLRFVDEGRGDVAVTNELARSADVRGACLVFDGQAWDGVRKNESPLVAVLPAPNPWLLENGGDLYQRATPAELALDLGIDPINLENTIASFNEAARKEQPQGLPVPRTGRARPLRPPYCGLKVVPGITFTMGGVSINGRAQVLDLENRPIGGLFAAGDVIGGLMGGYRGGYTGGLSQAVVTGMMAGKSAAGDSKASVVPKKTEP